ncbi:MAG: transglutaminase family protein [Candidatus Aminicenantes bacterium]|nr:MAG: transglutaminase family protein [Candidatus Aminicenantes bacterium]
MKILILLLLVISPIREVENIRLSLPTRHHEIFVNYANDNFSQKLIYHHDMLTAEIKSSNFLSLNLNFRVFPNKKYIAALNPHVQEMILDLFDDSQSLKNYLTNVSYFLSGHIRYSEKKLPQDAAAVFLFKRANCVGFANVMKVLLDSAGIKNKLVKGFYLKKGKKNALIPIPHRWVEIHLANGIKFFYDPQYQRFSANYIATRDDVDFKRVKKFKVYVIKKSKKIVN